MEPHEFSGARWKAGLTRAQVALELGVAESTIARWERGDTHIPATKLDLIRRVLDVDRA